MCAKALQKTFATSHGIKTFALFRQIDGIFHKVAKFRQIDGKTRKGNCNSLCSRNFQNVKLRFDFFDNFTGSQILREIMSDD